MTPLAHEIYDDLAERQEFEAGATLTGLHLWLGEPIPKIKAALAELRLAQLVSTSSSRYFVRRGVMHGTRADSAARKKHAARLIAAGVPQREAARAAQLSHRTVSRMVRGSGS